MKTHLRIIIGLVIVVFIGGLSANTAFGQEYNPRDEFALTQGGANGLWNYGFSTSDADNTLNLFTVGPDTDTIAGCSGGVFERWRINNGDTIPQIARHNPALTCSNIPSNAVFMHPGFNNQRAVLRFNAPVSGTFQITGTFQKQASNATSDLKIIKNATLPGETVLYTGTIGAVYQQSFNFTVTIAAGDKIDFSVGDGDINTQIGDGSSISVTIGQPVTACSVAPANLQVNVPAENSPSDVQSINTNAQLVGNATYTNMGKVSRAFEFDGNGDYVRIEDNPAQRPATAVTVEGWFKFDSASGIISLISKPIRNSPFNSYALYLDGGSLRGLVGNASQFTRVASNFTPQAGVWHHLAFTYDFSGGVSTLKLYANGVEVTSGQDGTANLPLFYDANPYPLLIGGDFENNSPGFFLDGQADEVSIYGRALAQTEIFNLVKQGSYGKCPPTACVQSPNNLVSWFAGEQNALDSRSNNHGTLFNGTTFQTAKVGQGFKFDGVDDRVEIPDSPSLKPQRLTVETWVKFDSLSSNTSGGAPSGLQYLVFKKNTRTTNFEGYALLKNSDNTLSFAMANASGLGFYVSTTGFTVTTGVNYHVVGTFDGMFTRIYVNGALLGTTGGFSFTPDYDTRPVFLGTSGEAFDGKLNGVLDEVSIYDRALSDSEIQSIYNAGQSGKCKPSPLNPPTNQIAWFSGDGDTRDFTGLNQNGTNNGATFTVGKVGQAFNFNGSSNVEAANAAQLNPGQLTIETWVYKSTGGDADLVGKDGENAERQYWLGAASNSRFRPHLSTTNNGLVFFDGATAYNLNEWYHVAMTYDGSNLRLYVNGVLDGSTAATGSIITTTQPLRIGGGAPTGQLQNYLNGRLDEVSLYDRALSANEIGAIYNAGVAGKLKEKPTAVNLLRSAKTSAALAPTTVQLSDATVNFAQVTTAGTTSQNGIDLALLPKLPLGITSTGLAYDVSTTAVFTTATVCFNLPSLSNYMLTDLRVLHLEGGAWIDRTAAGNTLQNFCTSNLTSLSPFVIVQGLTPLAANVPVGGRVITATANGIRNAIVTLTDMQGNTRMARTSSFGWFAFEEVTVGETYIISIQSKRFVFSQNTQVIHVSEATNEIVFTADY